MFWTVGTGLLEQKSENRRKRFSNLYFANNTFSIAAGSGKLLRKLELVSQKYGLKIKVNDCLPNATCKNRKLLCRRQVCLVSMLHKTGSCEYEIRRQIELAGAAMIKLTRIWKNQNITKNTKINLVNAVVFPVFLWFGHLGLPFQCK